ncbi:orotate phosphoribosyltransferase [Ornithinimicrobium sp. W1665]|uniref:orotate phosphoribosyltransferase n=1 Tax=Ornithinimicrobium sp. W1665 TaxID=3416666 RepID=UPI003CF04BF6
MSLAADLNKACRLTGTFRLRSGQVLDEYFDKYSFEADPRLHRRVAEAMADLVPPNTQVLGALEMGGIPLGTLISQITDLPVAFIRKEAKGYGTGRLIEGAPVENVVVTVIEDIITSGGSVRAAAVALRHHHANVSTAVCAIDRSPRPGHALQDIGVWTESLFTLEQMNGHQN